MNSLEETNGKLKTGGKCRIAMPEIMRNELKSKNVAIGYKES
jgi:hypothetical protein